MLTLYFYNSYMTNLKIFILFLVFIVCEVKLFSAQAYELVSIQAISTTRRSFVTRKGKIHGVAKGQRGTFTSENVSVVALAEEVTGQYTLWKIADKEGTVPFRRSELVSYNPAQESVWYNLVPYHEARSERPWLISLKGTFVTAFAESISEVLDNDTAQRQGQQFSASVLFPFGESFYGGAGLRLDQDASSGRGLGFSSQRFMAMAIVEYHFPRFNGYNAHLYAGLHVGVGKSSTQIAGLDQEGSAVLLPVAKVGVETKLSHLFNVYFETSLEAMTIEEEISVPNIIQRTQKSTLINGKFSIGVNFHI